MDELIKTFHIDVKLLIAQLINFGIVLTVLYFLALKPLMKLMKERTAKIEKGLKDAEQIEKRMVEIKAEEEKMLARAKKQAEEIVSLAGKLAEDKKKEILAKTQKEIMEMTTRAKEEAAIIKTTTMKEIEKESMGLVVAVAKKVLKEATNTEVDEKIIQNKLNRIKA